MTAIKDFLPISDVKITTEKKVKQKPTIEERTTVETPGKPSPADLLENIEEKKPKKQKKLQSTTQKKAIKPGSTLIITEKPQAADKIANALGSPRKLSEHGVSYFTLSKNNRTISVASAVGHLFGLDYIKGQRGWPIYDVEWRPSYVKKGSSFTKKYYDLLKKLAAEAEEIIIATDFDVEGEVIGWNITRFICKRTSAKRMKFSTLTSEELRQSYAAALPTLNWENANAGEARHILDWLYGINLSRALMGAIKEQGSFRLLSIGRVQGPALKIIVDREREIEAFSSKPFWQVFATVEGIELKYINDIFDKKELDKFNTITSGSAETKKNQEHVQPPHPFDLTSLQREAYNLYKISPSQTLATAQKLYLDGFISYPRTSSQKIPQSIEPKKILEKLSKMFPECKEATRAVPVEGKKSDPAHPSIYPTGELPVTLSEQERKIFNLIVKRFIAAFSPDAVIAQKKITLNSNDLLFTTSGSTIIEKGWMSVYPNRFEEQSLPDIQGEVSVSEVKNVEKETQPPRRYTPTSLITTLEKKNLGTKATRSMIVDILFDRGYLEGTSITATELGRSLINALEKYSPIIIDENLTRQIEEEMENMQGGEKELEIKEKKVIAEAKEIIGKIAIEFKSKQGEIGKSLADGLKGLWESQKNATTLQNCPTCKEGSLRIMYSKKNKRYFVACSKYPSCTQTFSLPPNSLIKKSDKDCPDCSFPKLLAIRKGKRPWEFCFNPECPSRKKESES